jgi:hypothetical protein
MRRSVSEFDLFEALDYLEVILRSFNRTRGAHARLPTTPSDVLTPCPHAQSLLDVLAGQMVTDAQRVVRRLQSEDPERHDLEGPEPEGLKTWYEIIRMDGGALVTGYDEGERETEEELIDRAAELGLPKGSTIDQAQAFLEDRGWYIEAWLC